MITLYLRPIRCFSNFDKFLCLCSCPNVNFNLSKFKWT